MFRPDMFDKISFLRGFDSAQTDKFPSAFVAQMVHHTPVVLMSSLAVLAHILALRIVESYKIRYWKKLNYNWISENSNAILK